MKIQKLLEALNELLEPEKFRDYCPNGLQIQGKKEVKDIVCGVSASEALINEAVKRGADTIIVHHGYFWKNENPRITGIKRVRIKKLLEHDINLIAYHLPLDANEKVGNNHELGRLLKLKDVTPLSDEPLVLQGEFDPPVTIEKLTDKLTEVLGRVPYVVPVDSPPSIRRVAFCSGAAQDYLEKAADAGAQAYLSGEISERTVLEARELGVPYFAVGHHASETLGIRALSQWLSTRFPQLNVSFVNIDNPI